MKCRLCNEEKPLGDSHIIPKSFFPPKEPGNHRPNRLLSNKEGVYPKKSPNGVYDQTILCHDCERKFSRFDDYAQKLLLQNEARHSKIEWQGETYGFEISKYDYDLLKRFFISVLWRASVSSHDFFRRIALGPHEILALQAFKSESPISPQQFSVILAKFNHPAGKSMLDPYPKKIDGINYNAFYLGGYNAWIKTDLRPTLEPFSALMLKPDQPLKIISRDFLGSKELPLFREIAIAANNSA